MSVLTVALVCARGGSKGIPQKNLARLAGHPLIAYTIAVALACRFVDHIVLSTDDEAIAEAGRRYGAAVPFLRPAELALDDTAKIPVLQHAVREIERGLGRAVGIVLDLQPTSPLRTVEDVERCWSAAQQPATDVALTVAPARSNPYYNLVEPYGGYVVTSKPAARVITRRQDAPPVYALTGSVYAYRRDALMAGGAAVLGPRTRGVIVPEERAIDIDSAIDLKLLELLVRDGVVTLPPIAAR